jgi:hypothetical protein
MARSLDLEELAEYERTCRARLRLWVLIGLGLWPPADEDDDLDDGSPEDGEHDD